MCKEYRGCIKGKDKNYVASPTPTAHAAMLAVVIGWQKAVKELVLCGENEIQEGPAFVMQNFTAEVDWNG